MTKCCASLAIPWAGLAIVGLLSASTLTPSVVFAQETTETTTSADASATPEFMSDYVPTECTVQFGYVARNDLPERLAQDFTETMDAVMLDQPVSECDAITGTDDGETKNFNFAHAHQGIYKVITESEPTYDEKNSLYLFNVVGVQFTPITAEGELQIDQVQMLLSIGSGICETDDPDLPYNIFCEFAAAGENQGELAVGHLSYLY